MIKQRLSDRLSDFIRYYEKPKPRKDITYENYRIEDDLPGLNVTRGWDKKSLDPTRLSRIFASSKLS